MRSHIYAGFNRRAMGTHSIARTRDVDARFSDEQLGTEDARLTDMPVPYPHHYQAWLVRTLSSRARVEAPPRPIISCAPSAELDGDATAWSAEQLLLSAIGTSVLTTFEALAARAHVTVLAWGARVGGTVERTDAGPRFMKFVVEMDIEVNDVERARAVVEETRHHCLISNSLAVPVELEAKIHQPIRKAG
jgi:organic hydroperoxide reductase OsmC/OhrA